MRKLAMLAVASVAALVPLAGPKPKLSLIFTMKGHVTRDEPAVTADGRRIYYLQDSTELYVYDRTTRRSTHVMGNMIAGRSDVAVSPTGDRLVFCRNGEDGDGPQLWTVALDPKTGLTNGMPRRVSLAKATDPTFSPDGKSIAFGAQSSRDAENLVVVPANGGPERMLAVTQGDIWPIRWFNADSIYFGLSFNDRKDAAKNGMYRIGVSGGTPKFVLRMADWGTYPGLSPDGRFILGWEPMWDSVIVATSAGQRVGAYAPGDSIPTPDVWVSGTHAVGWRQRVPSAVHVVNLADGRDRVLTDSAATYSEPQWSPNGSRILSLRRAPAAIIVSDPANGARRTIPLSRQQGLQASVYWSPDARWIFYRERHDPGAIELLDVASGKVRELAAKSTFGPVPRWRGDSRAILYARVDSSVQADSTKSIDVHEITLDGQDRLLHTIKARCSGGLFCGKFVDDSLLSTWAGNEYRVTNFRARGTPRLVFKRNAGTAQPVPTFSSDGRWMAVRHQAGSDQAWSIELMRSDGSARKTIPLSVRTAAGGNNPWISADGSELVVASVDCSANTGLEQSKSPTCAGKVTFYRIDVATGKATAVATAPRARHLSEVYDARLSSDGRSLAYVVDLDPYVDFYDFDLTELLKPPR